MNSDGHRFLKPGGARLPASRAFSPRIFPLLAGFCLLTSAAQAVTFTNNARIEITDSTGSLSRSAVNGDLTVMCWFKISIPSGVTVADDMTILANQSGGTTTNNTHAYNIYFNAASGTVDFTAKGTGGLYRQTLITRPFIDRWYHVAVAASGANYFAYADGQAVAIAGEGASGNTSVTNGVSIGGWGSGKYLRGEVQEVAVYQAKLLGTQIAARMFQDQSTNLNIRGYYKLGASTNSADWLKNFATGGVAAAGIPFPALANLAFEETDQAGEQSLYDSRKNKGTDSIAPLSGAFSWSQTALARPTPGIAFQFAYGYSSALPQSGGSGDAFDLRTLGSGWRHSFDVRLVRGESSTVLDLLTWDGGTEVWDRSPTNTLIYRTRHKEYRGELIKLNDGSDDHEWITPERLVFRFRNPDSGNPLMDGRLLEIRDFNSNHVQIIWNEGEGYIVQVMDSVAGQYNFVYNTAQLLTNISFGTWRVLFDYDTNNTRLISKSISNTSGLYTNLNTTWRFEYNANGLLARITDQRNFTNTLVQYDQYGRQTNQMDALNRATATRYGVPAKRQITPIDPDSKSWIETYDRKGHILAQQDPLTNITSYTYDTNGNRISITEPLGWKTLFAYDSRANVIARTNELGEITRWTFHGFFNKATNEVNALGWTNHFELDNATGNLLRHYDAIGTLVSYTYAANGLVLAATDANGNMARFAYDTNGFLIAQSDAANNTNFFAVSDVAWKLAQTNALGQITTFAYDLNGNAVRTVDPLQRVFTKTYDANGNLLSASDAKGQFTTNTFDAASQKISTTDRTGTNTTRFSYTLRGELLAVTNALTNVVVNGYDNANRLVTVTDPAGNTITNVYDANGNKIALIDQLGQTWGITYDRLNRVIAETDPLGDTRQTTYDPVGRIKTITTPRGFVTTHDYDGRGRLTKWVDAENSQWLYAYDGVGNITNITDALNGHYVMGYSNRNERILERNQDGFEWRYTYDELLRLKTQRDPNGTIRTLTYDEGGRALEADFSSGRVNAFNYDENNNPAMISRSDPGKPATVTILDYDAMDRVTQCRDTFNKTINYSYDALGRIITLRYPDGKTLTNRYDALSRLTNQVDWTGRQLTYAYDKANRLIGRTYPNGITQTNTFDTAGRITDLSYLGPLSFTNVDLVAYYPFNGDANDLSGNGNHGATNGVPLCPDRFGNPNQAFLFDGSNCILVPNSPSLDLVSNLTISAWVCPSALSNGMEQAVVSKPRSPVGTGCVFGFGGRSVQLAMNNNSAARNIQSSRTESNDVWVHIAATFDGIVGRIYINGTNQFELTDSVFALLSSSQPLYIGTEGITGSGDRAFRGKVDDVRIYNRALSSREIQQLYQPVVQPVVPSSDIALHYAYDRNGNKTASTEKGTFNWPMPSLRDETSRFTASGRITNRVDALHPTDNFTYQFDPSGNMTNATGGGQSWRLTYDEDNRTTSLFWVNGAMNDILITNRYDALGRRISRKQDGDETRYVLDLAGNMERTLCDMNSAGVITAWYVHGPDLCYKVDATNGLICYHADAQANIIALTDGNTNTVAQYAYTPYGRNLGSTNSQPSTLNSQPFLFVGSQGVMEELPSLYFMRARYYSADATVFLSTDPVKNIGPTWKPIAYAYVHGSPLRFLDPSGNVNVEKLGSGILRTFFGALDVIGGIGMITGGAAIAGGGTVGGVGVGGVVAIPVGAAVVFVGANTTAEGLLETVAGSGDIGSALVENERVELPSFVSPLHQAEISAAESFGLDPSYGEAAWMFTKFSASGLAGGGKDFGKLLSGNRTLDSKAGVNTLETVSESFVSSSVKTAAKATIKIVGAATLDQMLYPNGGGSKSVVSGVPKVVGTASTANNKQCVLPKPTSNQKGTTTPSTSTKKASNNYFNFTTPSWQKKK